MNNLTLKLLDIAKICILLATLTVVSGGVDLEAPTFRVKADNVFSKGLLYYRTLMLDESSTSIYVGAMNSMYKLWVFNINDTTNRAFFSEKELPPAQESVSKCVYRSRDHEFQCQNHVRVILKLPDGSLYVCSTNAYSPQVTKFDSATLEFKDSLSGAAICPVDPNDNSTAVWIEKGNPHDIPSIYAGTVTDFTHTNRIIYRPPLLDAKGEVLEPFMRTVHTDSKWLNDPNFVGSFDVGDQYVYFFFRETAVEYINCGKAVYSRVARVCKNDVGGQYVLKQNWATFLKARLNCSISGEFPFYFNEIQDVVKVVDAQGDIYFYATFTTNLNGIYGSAVCAFSLRSINDLFERGVFKEQVSSSSAWLPVLPVQVPNPRPGQCVGDSKSISDTALHFIKSHPLMDSAVPTANTKVAGEEATVLKPLFYKRDSIFTKLAVDRVDFGGKYYFIIFVGTTEGEIYKIAHWQDSITGASQSTSLAVYKLSNEQSVMSMQILTHEYLYIAQDSRVSQIQVGQCSSYRLCVSCSADPYCSWNTLKQQCDRWQESHDYTAGYVRITTKPIGGRHVCDQEIRQLSRTMYRGDSIHLDCFVEANKQEVGSVPTMWLRNNKTLDANLQRYLVTVDGGLVIVNASVDDSGQYDCVQQRQITLTYQLNVKDVNCDTPQTVQSYRAVYTEWCREFQEYKHKMGEWTKKYEENLQCFNKPDVKKLSAKNVGISNNNNNNLKSKNNRIVDVKR